VALLERLARRVAPSYVLGEAAKSWVRDRTFMDDYRRLVPGNDRSAERKWAIRSLVASIADLPGDTAEAGVYMGATSYFICQAAGKPHHAFDSFEGLSAPIRADGEFWTVGDLSASEARARSVLEPFDARVFRGWIPDVFDQAEIDALCFAHIDVDLYEPTLASLERFYPLLTTGGMMVCDDYGFETCPGARRAVDEFISERPERVVHLPTGQGLIVKR
jgi:hypothetical protein